MNSLYSTLSYILLMLLAGLGIPLMATLNGGLGVKLQSPALATTILFVVAGVVSLGYLVVSGDTLKLSAHAAIPLYFYLGGLFVIFYIISITWVSPKFGIGNSVAFVLLGQLISMSLIDHYGFLGARHYPVSMQRFSGLVLMALGVFLSVRRY